MKKFSIQFSILLFSFVSIWLGLSQLNWLSIFNIEENNSKIEQQLGSFYMENLKMLGNELSGTVANEKLEEIKEQICKANGIKPEKIKLHLVKTSEVNAFAAPDNHLVIFTGLIDYSQSFEELAGIMAHEIAHIEKNHIMKKLAKEIGLSVLLSAASSGTISVEAIKMLSSTAYDRSMETEADTLAVEYLIKSEINPAPMADLMYRLSLDESTLAKNLTFISTHPNTDERVENILNTAHKKNSNFTSLFPDIEWGTFKKGITE